MVTADVGKQPRSWRLIGLGLLLFVFFLPLHFHLSPTTLIAKECSCLQGTRTQLALAVEATLVVSLALFASVAIENESVWILESSDRQKVRGPPVSTSL